MEPRTASKKILERARNLGRPPKKFWNVPETENSLQKNFGRQNRRDNKQGWSAYGLKIIKKLNQKIIKGVPLRAEIQQI